MSHKLLAKLHNHH